jgi:hypothetical protein
MKGEIASSSNLDVELSGKKAKEVSATKKNSTKDVGHNCKIESSINLATYACFKFKNDAKELSRPYNFLSYIKSGIYDSYFYSTKPSFLPPNKSLAKTIFIDLNGTLIYQNMAHEIVIRPGAYELLVELAKYYELNVHG